MTTQPIGITETVDQYGHHLTVECRSTGEWFNAVFPNGTQRNRWLRRWGFRFSFADHCNTYYRQTFKAMQVLP